MGKNTNEQSGRQRVVIIFVILFAGIAAATWAWLYLSGSSSILPATPGGVVFEQLFPPETSVVISVNPSDEAEQARHRNLMKLIFKNKERGVIPVLVSQLTKKKELPEELVGLLGMQTRFALGVWPEESENMADLNAKFSLAFSVEDAALARGVLEGLKVDGKVARDPKITKNIYFVPGLVSNDYEVGLIADVIFITNGGSEMANEIITRYQKSGNSFAKNELFKKAFSKYSPPFTGYAFVNVSDGVLSKDLKFEDLIGEAADAQLLVIRAEEDGFKFERTTLLPQRKGNKDGGKIAAFKVLNPASGTIKVPMEANLMRYEGSGLADYVSGSGATAAQIETQLRALTGLNFEADIAPFFNGDFVFVVRDVTSILPDFALYVDASGQAGKAREFVEKMAMKVDQLVMIANMTLNPPKNDEEAMAPVEEKLPVISQEKIDFSGLTGRRITISLSNISESILKLPLLNLFKQDIHLSYAVTADEIFVISTSPVDGLALGNVANTERSDLYTSLKSKIRIEGPVFFVDAEAVKKYLTKVVGIVDGVSPLSADRKITFDAIVEYISPIKGFMQISKQGGDEVYEEGFLKIGE